PGDLVTVEVRVKNLHTGTIYIATTGRYDSVDILPAEDYAIVDPGAIHSFYFSFSMPDNGINLDVWSFFWTGEEWYQDDYSYIDIALIPPEEKEVNMGFTLKITNVPEGAAMWTALFYNEPRIYSPVLELDEPWDYADDPEARTDLMIRIFDSDLREIFTDTNLGPIEDGKSYTYNCSTGVLYEAILAASLWPLAIIGGLGILGLGATVALAMARR
ncbi:unnamed protein product, partial [marine sediment metagenome]